MQWASGDSLDPSSYTPLLENVTDIVHTVGIISEVDYKSLANAKNLCEAASGASRVVGEMIGMRDRGNPFHAQHPAPTFERMNRDTGITSPTTTWNSYSQVIFSCGVGPRSCQIKQYGCFCLHFGFGCLSFGGSKIYQFQTSGREIFVFKI